MPEPNKQELKINLTLSQIYDILCPKCKEKLLELAAQAGALDSIKTQLKEQWEKEK